MSLINDALKRARHEALRQDAEKGRPNYRAVPAHRRRAERPWLPFLVGGLVAASLFVVGLLIWPRDADEGGGHATVGPGTQEVSEGASDERPAAREPRADEGTPAETSSESRPAEPTSEGPAAVVEESREARPPRQESLPKIEAASRTVPGDANEPAALAPPASAANSSGRLEEGVTYRRQAVAADGSKVELGGIAYSDNRPIAVINGAVVSPGDMIAGFTVVSIEPDRVELEADGVRIFLTLR